MIGNRAAFLIIDSAKKDNIVSIDLSDQDISILTPEIGSLKYLQRLLLRNNRLNALPPEIGEMVNLVELDLSDNNINILPIEILKLTNLERIKLDGNPLDIPPIEIANQGIKAIRNYFYDVLAADEKVQVFEAKILVVGEGGVGKTTLINALFKEKFQFNKMIDQTTEGIDIKKWEFNFSDKGGVDQKFKSNIWDFGGQEIYHATHQFFLTRRSLYLFVWDARQEYHELAFYYWLNIINLLSAGSPVIFIMNKKDIRDLMIDEDILTEKFPNIKAFHKVSCATGEGITELRNTIRETLINLQHVGDLLPKKWLDIKEKLNKEKRNYINYDEYIKICQNHSMNKDQSYHLSRYFHDLAGILNFQDNPLLRNTMILKPEWATHAVYDVLDTKDIQTKKGKFNFRELELIWDNNIYPVKLHSHLLELMKKFELVFQLQNSQDYLVPEMLPGDRPFFQWDDNDCLEFEYHYDFMPKGIITRFIVINHQFIEKENYWKNGVILQKEGTRAKIISDQYNRKISISVCGQYKKKVLVIIRETIDYINSSLNNPSVREMVPCICNQCKNDKNPTYYNYEYLLRRAKSGKNTVDCTKSLLEIRIQKLLEDIRIEEKDPQEQYDVFISYSRKDLAIIQEIAIDFEKNNISYWWDYERIKPGEELSQKIEEGLNTSKNVLLCLSYNQLESGWSRFEYTSVLNKIIANKTNKKVIPLIIDNLDFDEIPNLLSNLKCVKKSDIKGYNGIIEILKK